MSRDTENMKQRFILSLHLGQTAMMGDSWVILHTPKYFTPRKYNSTQKAGGRTNSNSYVTVLVPKGCTAPALLHIRLRISTTGKSVHVQIFLPKSDPFRGGSGPHVIMVLGPHEYTYPKWHLDLLSHFCMTQTCDQQTHTHNCGLIIPKHVLWTNDKPGTGSEPYVIVSLCKPGSCGLIINSYVPSCLSINVLKAAWLGPAHWATSSPANNN